MVLDRVAGLADVEARDLSLMTLRALLGRVVGERVRGGWNGRRGAVGMTRALTCLLIAHHGLRSDVPSYVSEHALHRYTTFFYGKGKGGEHVCFV